MRSGQDRPVCAASVSSAARRRVPVQAFGSIPAEVSASQIAPMCPRCSPWQSRTSSAASRWSGSGRGAARQRRRRRLRTGPGGISAAAALARPLGEELPAGGTHLSLRDGGRSTLSTAEAGDRRLIRWYTDGRFVQAGRPDPPWPRAASTTQPAARSTRHARVMVCGLQPIASAMVARVTAQFLPVAWSARSAIVRAAASSVAAVMDTPAARQSVVNPSDRAHTLTSVSHRRRLVHTGTVAGTAPARSVQARRARRARAIAALRGPGAGRRACGAHGHGDRDTRKPTCADVFSIRDGAQPGPMPRYALP